MQKGNSVRIPLSGGFGNQLFQIIFALYVRQEAGQPVVVEGKRVSESPEHPDSSLSGLDWAILNLQYSDEKPFLHKITSPLSVVIREALSSSPKSSQAIIEKLTGFLGSLDEAVNELSVREFPKHLHLRRITGYFQHGFYFRNLSEDSRESLYSALKKFVEEKKTNVECANTAVHIRRGDYRRHPSLDVLGIDYYERAIELIGNKKGTTLVFTDEPEDSLIRSFAKNHGAHVARAKTARDVFYSLLQSDAIVGGNSSLSMSAAMLSRKADLSIFPSKWGSAPYHNFADRRAYPEHFIVLER